MMCSNRIPTLNISFIAWSDIDGHEDLITILRWMMYGSVFRPPRVQPWAKICAR